MGKKWEFVAKALLSDFEMLGDVGGGAILRDGRAQGVAWPETGGGVNSLDIENSCSKTRVWTCVTVEKFRAPRTVAEVKRERREAELGQYIQSEPDDQLIAESLT